MNYYEHHLGDYDGATAHLSWLEDCAYRRLICLYYRNEAPIPSDMKQACRLVRAASKPERDAVEQVLGEFFKLEADGWHHKRCDADIARYHEKSRKARESVSKRWANRDATAIPEDYERNTNVSDPYPERNTPRARPQTPDTKHHTVAELPRERSPNGSRLPADWVAPEDWLAYCRAERPDLDASAVACSFADYWHSKAGKDARKVDWLATWRTWVRKESPPAQRGRSPPAESFRERDQRLAAERVAEATGGLLSKRPTPPAQEVFDVTPRALG